MNEGNMELKGIDELLSGEPVAEPAPVETPEPVAEAPAEAEGQPRDEHGRFASQETGVEEPQAQPVDAGPPPADQLPKEEYVALKAVRNENKELKEAVAAMQAQMAQIQQRQPAPQAEPEPEFWDNPQAVIASQVQRAVMEALQADKQQQTMTRINESEVQAKTRHADYDDAFRAFQQAASANPALVQQMTAASDPAEFAYSTGRKAMDLQRVGSIDELLKSERAKWEAELKAAIPAQSQSFPATTATDGSVGGRTGPTWAGAVPIDQLLAR